MVKNGPNSLRNTTSNLSLRGSASTQSLRASAHEYAARRRIAELEAQVAALEARQSATLPQPCRAVPKTKGPFTFSDYDLPEPAERFAGEWTPQEEAEKVEVFWQKEIENAMSEGRPHPGDDLRQGRMEIVKHSVRKELENEVEQRGFKKEVPLERLGLDAFTFTSGLEGKYIDHSLQEGRKKKIEDWSLFEKFNETLLEQAQKPNASLITKGLVREGNALKSPEAYTQPFCDFLTENPTVWHAVDYFEKKLNKAGFKKLSERQTWNEELERGGKYYVSRNGSSLIAFTVGGGYKSGNGVAMVAGHVDALTARLKPVSNKRTSAGYVQLGVAPYAGALNSTWWDRDLGVGGRVIVKDSTGKITTKLVKLGWPIARIPTLAPHFGVGMVGQNNAETQAVPIIGLDNPDIHAADDEFKNLTLGGEGTFAATQPPKLVRIIANELSIQDYSSIVNWELELYDTQPAQTGGLDKEFIFAGRIDDKLCSWAAMEGLLASASAPTSEKDGIVKLVGVFDDEEIGSLLRQGARGNFLPGTIERIAESFSKNGTSANLLSQTYANSFLVSADVTHAVNPNFLGSYLEGHAPRLNVGLVVCADSNGHMTTDSVSTALLTRVAEKSGSRLQLFMIRNDSRSGGTVGPMLSSAMGVRAIDAGIPQLSMHSIRATTGALDPGLGAKIFKGFFDNFEAIDKEFE